MAGYPSMLGASLPDVVADAEAVYGLDLSISGEPRYGYRSTILFLSSKDREVVLKVFGGDVSEHRVEAIARLQGRLQALGLPVLAPIPRRDGLAGGDVRERTAVLYPRAVGSVHRLGHEDELRSAGQFLGRLHTMDIADLGLTGIGAPIHNDFRAQNILFENGRVSCVLDWDDAEAGDRLTDLSYSLIFFQAVLDENPPGARRMKAFLNGYESFAPLTEADWDRIPGELSDSLSKGLRLWEGICDSSSDPQLKSRVARWISAYRPIGDGLPTLVEQLRSG